MLTLYLYLSDVEAGGGTNFDKLGITVTPKLGRVLLWPSVLNDEPNEQDERTTHQALPVEKGLKYGTYGYMTCLLLLNPCSHA
jgi:prolyl 4-hydroxylase